MNEARTPRQIVKVLAIHEHKLVLVYQYRKELQSNTLELPGGKVKDNENPYDGAIRELAEETGLFSQELIELGTFLVPPGSVAVTLFFTNQIHLVQDQRLDDDEHIDIVYVDIEDAFLKVASGEWSDTRLGMGLILARSRGLL
ncbi:hypothetical protein BVG16_27090 [Paenibacillus selenitireducens]|uniref:Nudix hydrolase domain-containing protein n=1 Tax=Paenibacillus selenitireducens TaxID=1324314 RepID=A0A1T2X1L3_9BACL|nr:NUDIX hydrolase [Paenibacillus selenitireducens]OPA73754.1 hypothetical protein BVG16_27090 [Paenibacillus selenitireducens]